MPRLGQPLAPAASDLIEVLATAAPLDSTVPFDPKSEAGYSSGNALTGDVRPTRVQHHAAAAITVYNYLGEDRVVAVADLETVLNPSLAFDRRLHLRCPKCVTLPNGGLHETAGPNSCPGREPVKFMVCPICASRGFNKRVYESDDGSAVLPVPSADEADANFESYELPNPAGRKAILQGKLELHMASFHASDAQALYGIRREPSGNGWRIVKS